MRIRPSLTMVPLLAMMLTSPVVHEIGEPFSDVKVPPIAKSPRTNLAVLPAPTGHRQPTLNDLPPWLRDEEKPGTEPNTVQGPGQGAPGVQPNDGVPRICEPC
jgi:hypothetical protein